MPEERNIRVAERGVCVHCGRTVALKKSGLVYLHSAEGFESGCPGAGHPPERRLDELRLVGSNRACWCGEESGHDWPGRVNGTAHPR